MSYSAAERANIKMDHSGEGPLMSLEEAARIEKENTAHLLEKRKLSLIVDLDQTILHATMDPTVGEWMRAKQAFVDGSTTPPPESVNWPALEDVVKFQLPDDYRGTGHTHPNSTWYYVKPRSIFLLKMFNRHSSSLSHHRPGLKRFMSKISEIYEMHVYTMGTRSYANAVCAALDPQGVWFGSRILTRSESGSKLT
jgi:RNA polymerase II subunit A-like phosphatase